MLRSLGLLLGVSILSTLGCNKAAPSVAPAGMDAAAPGRDAPAPPPDAVAAKDAGADVATGGGAGAPGDAAPPETATPSDADADVDIAPTGDAHPGYDGAPTLPPALPGWTFVWSDEFEEPAIDETAWNILDVPGTKANAELEYYTARKNDELGANVFLEDGALVIEAREEMSNGFDYTSARINTELGMASVPLRAVRGAHEAA